MRCLPRITVGTSTGRAAYNISSGNRLDFSENLYKQNQPGEGPTCPIDCVSNGSHYSTYVLSDVWTINPNIVNEFRDSLMRSHQPFAESDTGTNYGQKLGMAQLTALTFPGITVDGSGAPAAIGTSFKHSLLGYTTFTEADTLTFIHGKHILKFGGEYNNSRDNLAWADLNAGDFTFTGQFSENPQNPSATGAGLADFLLGTRAPGPIAGPRPTGNRTGTAQAFAQDDFKITPRLTLNLGLRWLQQRGYTEQFNRIGTFDPTIINPATNTLGAMWYGGQRIGIRANGNNALQATKWANFQPRIGFAWAPKNNWSIRGAYGIFDDMWGGDTYQSGVGMGIAVAGNDSAGLHGNPLVPFMTLDGGHTPPAIPAFPPSAAFYNGSGVTYWPYHIPMAYVQQWHFSVQHQFNNNMMLEVGYVGTRGRPPSRSFRPGPSSRSRHSTNHRRRRNQRKRSALSSLPPIHRYYFTVDGRVERLQFAPNEPEEAHVARPVVANKLYLRPCAGHQYPERLEWC